MRSLHAFVRASLLLAFALHAQAADYDPYDSLVAVVRISDAPVDGTAVSLLVDGVRKKVKGTATGFCVAKNHFVTNDHIVPAGSEGSVVLLLPDSSTYPVKLVARDRDSDLALLRFDGEAEVPVQPLTLSKKPWRSLRGKQLHYPAMIPIFVKGSNPELVMVQRRIYVVGHSSVHKRILFEPESMAGSSGSPIVQQDFSVVGVVQGNFLNKGWQGVAKAIPAEFVAEFLRRNSVKFAEQEN